MVDFVNRMFTFVVLIVLWILALLITAFIDIEKLDLVNLIASIIIIIIILPIIVGIHFLTGRDLMSSDWLLNRLTREKR